MQPLVLNFMFLELGIVLLLLWFQVLKIAFCQVLRLKFDRFVNWVVWEEKGFA